MNIHATSCDSPRESSVARQKLLVFACALSALINLPKIILSFARYKFSLGFIDDADELFYLRAAWDSGYFRPHESIYFEAFRTLPLNELLFHWRPDQGILPFLIGTIARVLNLNPIQIGFVLDLFVPVVSFFFAVKFFDLVLGSQPRALLATILFLCFPWAFALDNYLKFSDLLPFGISALPFVGHSTIPMLEGVESQVSYPLFAAALYFLARALTQGRRLNFIVLGILSGGLAYCYFFAWAFMGALGFFSLLIGSRESRVQALLFFGLSQTLASSIALWQIGSVVGNESVFLTKAVTLSQMWYLSVPNVIVALLASFSLRNKTSDAIRLLTILFIAATVAEHVLMNVQPFFAIPLEPIFFSVFYAQPLLSSLLACFVILKAGSIVTPKFAAFTTTALCVLFSGTQAYAVSTRSQGYAEISELLAYLTSIKSRKVIAVMPFSKAFETSSFEWDQRWIPNTITAYSHHFILKDSWGLEWGAMPTQDNLQR
ncbi:MAG: hypothetical protein KDD62_13420, partial [Bdellovibrionales bacterium]|nr:hypothetical protein [Bdellovibrionales bacterium]